MHERSYSEEKIIAILKQTDGGEGNQGFAIGMRSANRGCAAGCPRGEETQRLISMKSDQSRYHGHLSLPKSSATPLGINIASV